MEDWIKSQIKYGLRYIPAALLRYPFCKKRSEETERIREAAGGHMIRGVCRANDRPEQETFDAIKNAGIGWVRGGFALPFNADGTVREGFYADKEKYKRFAEAGIKVMFIAPGPRSFYEIGIDSRTPEGAEFIRKSARFYIEELRGIIGAVQIGNELSTPRFRGSAHTLKEACDYIGIFAEAIKAIKGDILVGYNLVGPQVDQNVFLMPYMEYLDYVGVDIYIGSFFKQAAYMWVHGLLCKFLWAFLQKPVIVCECGYLGAGAPKTSAEKLEILRAYGYDYPTVAQAEEALRQDPTSFFEKCPPIFAEHAKRWASGSPGEWLLSLDGKSHVYSEIPGGAKIKGCPHTPEGQAAFFRRLLPSLEKLPFVCGLFIYSWYDDKECNICGQESCPMETKWGINHHDGTPKPAYYAIRDLWTS